MSLAGSYRYSVEKRLRLARLSAPGTLELAKRTHAEPRFFAFLDKVGRSGSRASLRDLTTAGVRASLTQVLARQLLGQLSYELGLPTGFRPALIVSGHEAALGLSECALCQPEHEPESALSPRVALLVRRA